MSSAREISRALWDDLTVPLARRVPDETHPAHVIPPAELEANGDLEDGLDVTEALLAEAREIQRAATVTYSALARRHEELLRYRDRRRREEEEAARIPWGLTVNQAVEGCRALRGQTQEGTDDAHPSPVHGEGLVQPDRPGDR